MPTLLYFVTEDWFFCSHFLPMARAAQQAGLEVAVATRVRAHGEAIAAEGFRVIPIDAERGSLAPLQVARNLLLMTRTLRQHPPHIVHCIALRNVVLGGIAARLSGSPALILAPTGLGALWTREGFMERLGRWAMRRAVRLLAASNACLLFENKEDPAEFGLSPGSPRIRLVAGPGVDPSDFSPTVEPPAPPLRVAVVARMLRAKGIGEAVEAICLARQSGGRDIELHLYGEPDPSNRDSLSLDELKGLAQRPGIYWHGRVGDVAQVWRQHHVALLLSRREGLPRSLVEAAASGRPLVATDVPGCREVVLPGRTGLLVARDDPQAAAAALAELHDDPTLRRQMGDAAHAFFLERFTADRVATTMAGLYRELAPDA